MNDRIVFSDRDQAWIDALQDAAFETNMDVDWETMKLVPIDRVWNKYEEGDFNVYFDIDQEDKEDNHDNN